MSQDISYVRISAGETVPLRHSVLWPDQPVSYVLLPEDSSGFHYGVITINSKDVDDSNAEALHAPVAVISLFGEALPPVAATESAGLNPSLASSRSSATPTTARFRKFACDPSYQGRGIGTGLLQHTFAIAKEELQCSVVWCDARMETAGWYERRGMRKFGETFWKGDIEYVRMRIDI
ncbi:hypothetical protein BDY19DRAFT_1057329 [Irpex rosettiformis]|uniref:Uncharacterized protein n=1 Tax=Irpex rosettiformis TaxID=378272 RepID=A0ACB8U344_9APHY|nr:hypothetical protein BDY19DRAFT_1057329 [Irpex rosettiformis]